MILHGGSQRDKFAGVHFIPLRTIVVDEMIKYFIFSLVQSTEGVIPQTKVAVTKATKTTALSPPYCAG